MPDTAHCRFCPFCEIVAGRAPATIVAEWSETMAIVPFNPVVDGHTLVIPRARSDELMVPWGTTGAPHAPHWCRVAERLQQELRNSAQARSRPESRPLSDAPVDTGRNT